MITLIVFDLDGTLIDSRRDLAESTNAMLAEYGAAPLEVEAIAAMVGEGAAVLVRRALAAAGLSPDAPGALERFLAQYDQRLTAHTRPYPGMRRALEQLRSRRETTLAVLTNKPARATTTILERLALAPYFARVVGGDAACGRKPDPAGLLSIVARARATPETTLLVGDSAVDLETARRARTRICLARFGFGFRFDDGAFRGDELFVDDPLQLPGLVAGL